MTSFTPIADPFPNKIQIAKGVDFYERPDIYSEIIYHLSIGECISIIGERRSGKSSLLEYVFSNLPENFIPVKIDIQSIQPRKDLLLLSSLSINAARKIREKLSLPSEIEIETMNSSIETVYQSFENDLLKYREILISSTSPDLKLVWFIDEIEVLKGYKNTNLFTFLHPIAKNDPIFRMLVAGYDFLAELATDSDNPVFFNAFHTIRINGLPNISAQRMIDKAISTMGAAMAGSDEYELIYRWTGNKPYFIKWFFSLITKVINEQKTDYQITIEILNKAKSEFVKNNDIQNHFNYLWHKHATERQRNLLSLLASLESFPSSEKLLEFLKEHSLVENDKQALQHLKDDLSRLEQLGFLAFQHDNYTFSSGCLRDWIIENKPL